MHSAYNGADNAQEGTIMDRMRRTLLVLGVALLLPVAASACGSELPLDEQGEERASRVGQSPEEQLPPSLQADGEVGLGTGTGQSVQVEGASIERKVIQTASVSLQVEAVSQAFQEVGRIAAGAGGFVVSSSFSNEGEEQAASVTIRVPAVRFQEVLAELRGLAVKVENEQSEASDVTEEFSDLGARLRNLEAIEAQYLEFLKRAEDLGEVLQVQDRINAVRADIEHVRGRMNLLDNLSELSTVTVHLRPEAAAEESGIGGPLDVAQGAWDASLDTLRGIAIVIVAVAVYSWWLVPILILLAVAGKVLGPKLRGRSRQQ
jgi:hypothetical protein